MPSKSGSCQTPPFAGQPTIDDVLRSSTMHSFLNRRQPRDQSTLDKTLAGSVNENGIQNRDIQDGTFHFARSASDWQN